MRMTGEDYPGFVRGTTSRGTSRAASVADSYIHPERLMNDLAKLYASRDRVMLSLTALDCAAIAAGTPIRTTSARERFMDLGMRLREIDAVARAAWQSEVAAAGGYKPVLRPILVKAGECDARGLKTLLSNDGKHLDATEYDELLSILEGAIVKAREAGIEDYAASLFANLDANTLNQLVGQAGGLRYLNADSKLLVQRLGDVLAELRDLFAVVVKSPDLESHFPQFWARLETMDPTTILTLLQTGRGSDFDSPLLTGVNPELLAAIADRVLAPDLATQKSDPNFATLSFWRKPLVLRLLREDQLSGGRALSLFLSSPRYDAAGFATVSRHLEALTETSTIALSGAVQMNSDRENAATADLLKTHFTNAFDKGTKAEVLAATSLLEIAIARFAGGFSKPMRAAFAVGFAGLMTHQETRDDLLVFATGGSGTGQTDLADAKVSWFNPALDIDGNRLRQFLRCLADEPDAVKTIAAAIGPTIASTARAAQGLPAGSRLPEGIGFIYGSMLSKFDSDARTKRAFFDGLGLGLTVLFATAGGVAGGPGTAMAAGTLGSGVLQNITSLIDLEPKNKLGLPMSEEGMREYFQCIYVMASYKWLSTETKKAITERLSLPTEPPSTQPLLAIVNGMLQITNASNLPAAELARLKKIIFQRSSREANGRQTVDQRAIDFFYERASRVAELTRKQSV